MKELENNYGIYMGVDDFLQEIKEKLNEIKSLKALYEYIGTDLGKDKTDLQLILEAYEKAKEKGYIRAPKTVYSEEVKATCIGYVRTYESQDAADTVPICSSGCQEKP